MKIIWGSILIVMVMAFSSVYADDMTTVEAKNSDISNNLDLEAIASIFGESNDLEDFEQRLNDPETQISNLDLNGDQEVDYLRVVEVSEEGTHLVVIQAVLAQDLYQDVATIEVEKDDKGETQVQVVGDVYMYGPDYIIEPVYVHPPLIYSFFWGPRYHFWHSPYYWGFYPRYYRPWRPYPVHTYKRNVHVHVNLKHTYRHTTFRKSKTAAALHKKSRRNDFGNKHPNKSFTARNKGVKNKGGLAKQSAVKSRPKVKSSKRSTGKKVQKNWQPSSKKGKMTGNVKNNNASVSKSKAKKPGSTVNKGSGDSVNKRSGDSANKRSGDAVNKRSGDSANKKSGGKVNKRSNDTINKNPGDVDNSKSGDADNKKSRW